MLHGRVRLTSPDTSWNRCPGDHLVIPPPATACTPSTVASCCSPSPNRISATTNRPVTTICPGYEANSPLPEAAIVNDFMTDNDDPGDHTDSTDL